MLNACKLNVWLLFKKISELFNYTIACLQAIDSDWDLHNFDSDSILKKLSRLLDHDVTGFHDHDLVFRAKFEIFYDSIKGIRSI